MKSLIVPKSSNTAFGNIPRAKSFYIGGYFDSGMFTYDSNLAFIDLDIGKKLFLNDTKIWFCPMWAVLNSLFFDDFYDNGDR